MSMSMKAIASQNTTLKENYPPRLGAPTVRKVLFPMRNWLAWKKQHVAI